MLPENPELENNILYELLIYSEWQQEPEVLTKSSSDRPEVKEGYLSKLLGPFSPRVYPPVLAQHLNNLLLPWAFSIGGNGAVIAVLQDTSLEIRTSRDEYGAIIGKTQVIRDSYPQWRRILWSPDCTMLACAHSDGKLDFYDLIGAHMFTIDSMMNPQKGKPDFRFAITGMAFSDTRIKNTQWSYEFIVANYLGNIHGYFVSPSDGYKLSHSFSLSSCYPAGITCLTYNPVDNLLFICGPSHKLSCVSTCKDAAQVGMSVWRLLSDAPYYKLALTVDEEVAYLKSNWISFLSYNYFYQSSSQDLVFKMSISPNGKILATIHLSGNISLWDLPSLKLKKHWKLSDQPNFSEKNPICCEPGMKKRNSLLSDSFYSHIIDVNWWSDEAIIMVRQCGAVTVSSIKTLQNLLGVSPEWFEPSPAVTTFCDRGFLAMECEVRVKGKRSRSFDDIDEEEESSDDDEPSIFAYTYDLAQKTLYFITDNDRFQPLRKKMKSIIKTYRLLCLKSTTPEELYSRKINNEEYGEALALAKTYNLDSDLVYQRQWRKMPATVESIHDYLSKIKKRSWVLHECMERVPESFEAAKELLHYGLQGTDLKALIAIGKGEDHGRFILSTTFEENDEGYEALYNSSYDADSVYEEKEQQKQKMRSQLLQQINFKKLTLEQKQLCQCRLKLLNYFDRLTTYEIILGGTYSAEELFDHVFFKKFRSQCGLEAAIHFAYHSNWEAVATLFSYHGLETLSHRLVILSHFPETTLPIEYQSLLPLFNDRENVFYTWDEHLLRESDWCETRFEKIAPSQDFVNEFYEKNGHLVKYRQAELCISLVTEWFLERAKEIESKSGLVDNALQLLKLGMQRNNEGLEKLFDDMSTLETLIYECGIKIDLSLKEFEELSELERVNLMMSTTTKDNFMKNVQQWLMPFLLSCSKYDSSSGVSLFKSYVLSISKDDLFYCMKLLENLKPDHSLIIKDFNELVTLSLDCVYQCVRTDELKNASAIHDLLLSLPDAFNKSTRKLHSLPDTVSTLKKHICVAELLNRNGLPVALSLIQKISNNSEEVKKLLTKLTRMASHRIPMLDEAEWTSLLTDILEMQKVLFQCVSYEDCYEIVLQSVLCSGKSENVLFAAKMMECNNKLKRDRPLTGPQSFKLPFVKSVALVLAASQEYFNSSADASDPCMVLAKSCLNLIEDVPSNVEEEIDLITSISLLKEFNLTILPLKVRLTPNRIGIVKEALKSKERNYKKWQKIMKLANLLRAGSSNIHEREGEVLTLIGEHALQVKDYSECLSACEQLITGGHKEGWQICYQLGGCNDFDNIPARSSLMSFALGYCSDDLIEIILKSRSELQLQVLQERVKFLVGDIPVHFLSSDSENAISEEELNGPKSLWQTSERTLRSFQNTTKTAKVVLSSVKHVQFWKDAINWIQPTSLGWSGRTSVDEDDYSNNGLTRPGICAFYDGLLQDAHLSKLEANYQRYARPDLSQSLELSSSILRASFIQDSLKMESIESNVNSSVLIDVVKAYLPEDTAYSLFLVLALKETEMAKELFAALPSSPIVLQFASLYYAFKIHISLGLQFIDKFLAEGESTEFCRKTLKLQSTHALEVENVDCGKYFELLQKYDKMLYDFVQAEILQSIGGGVDAIRFANDDVYKKDTILGIAMTLDDSVFNTALTLALHYNVSTWDLYITHLEYLFSETSIPASVVSERIEKYGLLEKLLCQKRALENRLRENIYSGLSGKDHDKLLICFSILENCGNNEDNYKVKPNVHKKLLTKFKAAMKNIDYKRVMSPESSTLYFNEILNDSLVHMFAKTASNIPKKGNTFYEPSNIYRLWTQKFFFEGNSLNNKLPSNKTEWVHRYESCTDMLQRLDPNDVSELINNVVFCEKGLETMSIDIRCEIVKRAVKFCRGKSSKHKNNIVLSTEWSGIASKLNSLHLHLQRLEDETLVQLRESLDPKVKDYCKEFDLSKSSIEKLQCLLTRIVLEGPDLELLKTFISCCPAEINWEPSDAYIKAINVSLQQLKQKGNSTFTCFTSISPNEALEKILYDITNQQEELMMIEDLATEILHEFCQDPDVSVSIRLIILQLLEKTNCISPEYSDLLLLYRTQAVVSSMWPNIQVSAEEVKDDFERKILFDSLLSLCSTLQHFSSLAKLLTHWPPFEQSQPQDYYQEQWTRLLIGLISCSDIDTLSVTVDVFAKAIEYSSFTEQCRLEVFKKLEGKGSILHTVKCALKSSDNILHSRALTIIKEKGITTSDYDDELLELILKHKFTTQVVSTNLYKPLIELLLHCQDDIERENYKSLDNVIRDLYEAGHNFEAGSLLLLRDSTHPALSTFSSAITALQRWLSATSS